MQLMSSIFILRKLIAQSVLSVETLIHFTKSIVKKSLEEKWGKMFHQLEEQINGYRNMNPDCKIVYQLFDPDKSDVCNCYSDSLNDNNPYWGTCLMCLLRNLWLSIPTIEFFLNGFFVFVSHNFFFRIKFLPLQL